MICREVFREPVLAKWKFILVNDKDSIMEERKRIRLSDLDRKHPFNVPEGYFDTLAGKIQQRVEDISGVEEAPAVPLRKNTIPLGSWWRISAVAASIALIVGLIWFTLPARQGALGPDALSAISDDDILDYLKLQDLDYDDLASQDVVQKAFMDESTLMRFLESADENSILELLDENSIYDETI